MHTILPFMLVTLISLPASIAPQDVEGLQDALAAPQCPLLVAYDPSCDAMIAEPALIAPHTQARHQAYFDREIPRIIHQIWFGDPNAMNAVRPATWQKSAQTFGYGYHLWTEADLPTIHAMMPPENAALLDSALERGDYWIASDLLRLSLLATYGGVYADVDVAAPSEDLRLIDLASLVPMRNIVFVTEHDGRNIGHHVAMFVGSGLIMAAKGHPLLAHLIATVSTNAKNVLRHGQSAMHATGPFFINRSLAGAITIVPITYLERYNAIDPGSEYERLIDID